MGHSGAFQRCEVPWPAKADSAGCPEPARLGPDPQAGPLHVPPAGSPSCPPGLYSLKGCRVTSQKLDSNVYSPNRERALWALLRHPDPLPPQGKRGFQPTPRLRIPHMLTSRNWPQGGASIQPGPAARERVVRHKEELSATKGHSAQRKQNLPKYCALLVRVLDSSV